MKDVTRQQAIVEAIARRGFVVIELEDELVHRLAQPWRLVLGLLGRAPMLTEVQPIHPIAGGRSFASAAGEAPLHTDSQLWLGRPPDLQVTACLRPASHGGQSVLVDAFALADDLERRDPELLRALLGDLRRMPFVFGAVFGATLARRSGRYVVTHSPRAVAGDALAEPLAAAIARAPHEVVQLGRGQVLLVDNHRMLHGRTAFEDPTRELLRVLAWLATPLGARPRWADAADAIADRLAGALVDETEIVRRAFGAPCAEPAPLDLAVLEVACGAPPGAVAQRAGVAEAALYRHRDALFATGRATNGDASEAGASANADPDDACVAALTRLGDMRALLAR